MRRVTHKLGRVSVQAGLLVLVGVLVANSSQVAPEIENNNNAKSIAYNMVPLFGTIMVQGEPAEGGIVSGTGTFPSGVMTIIKAQANDGWEFVRWQDGNVQAQRTVPVVSWTTYYTAYFKKSSDLECCGGAATDSEVTTKGNYTGYLYTDGEQVPGTLFESDSRVAGLLQLKLASVQGKLTAKLILQSGSLSFKAKIWDNEDIDGACHARLTIKSGEVLNLFVKQNFIWGAVTGGVFGNSNVQVVGQRNRFEDRKDLVAQEEFKRYEGYYTAYGVTTGGSQGLLNAGPLGYSYLTVLVKSRNKLKIAGVLADGTRVSQVSHVLECGEGGVIPMFVPLYRKGGYFSALLYVDREGQGDVRGDNLVARWVKEDVVGGFDLGQDIAGGHYNQKAPQFYDTMTFGLWLNDLYLPLYYGGAELEYTYAPEEILGKVARNKLVFPPFMRPRVVEDDGVPRYQYIGNAAGVKVTFNARTGVFKGSFNIFYDFLDIKGRLQHKAVRVPLAGVFLMDPDTGMVCAGAGHALFPTKEPIWRLYRLKKTIPVILQ